MQKKPSTRKIRIGWQRRSKKVDATKGKAFAPPTFSSEKRRKSSAKNMSIVLFLGKNVNEYMEGREKKIREILNSGTIQCERCLKAMKCHSSYERRKRESGNRITITVVWCRKCKIWHALLPDFLLKNKHYSGDEIENVIIESGLSTPVSKIETEASESTVRRWVRHVNESIRRAVGILKILFGQGGKAVSEIAIDAKTAYGGLEQILDMAPHAAECSRNKLGLANIWLGTNPIRTYI